MNTEKRRVYLFIAVGLLAAAVVGYGVWRASTPSTPSVSDTATATTEVATNSSTAGQIVPTPAPEESGFSTANTPPAPLVTTADDPYLAPNAVVQSAPTNISPTVVYRPDNIMDPPPTAEPVTAQPTPTPASTPVPTSIPPEAGEVSDMPEDPGAPTTTPVPEQGQPTMSPQTPSLRPDTPTTVKPAEPESAAPATTPDTPQKQVPATTAPQPAPAGSSLAD